MENRINILELLKDCPKGMELDCTMYNNVTFGRVLDGTRYPIQIQTPEGNMQLSEYGCMSLVTHAKCVIYPKGKTTWEGFVPPCKFKDGDVITCTNSACSFVAIFKEMNTDTTFRRYVSLTLDDVQQFCAKESWSDFCNPRLATEEEKEKLFRAIKDNGYKWNPETKVLEKLAKPIFKVGDKVRHKNNHGVVFTITSIEEDSYVCGAKAAFWFDDQDDYELVPNKFDISTLKPFDKVLVRNKSNEVWTANFYSHYDATSDKPFICVGWSEMNEYRYCIPYEVNNELLGTTNNTEEYGSR